MQTSPSVPQSVGTHLRTARESQGRSLDEVAARTRIRLTFLRGLEQDQFDDLPPAAYVAGFIRNYSLFLGVDPAEALRLYHAQTDAAGVEYMPDTRTPVGLGRRPSVRRFAVLIAGFIGLVILANVVYRNYRSPQLAGPTPPPAGLTAPAAETIVPPFRTSTPTSITTPAAITLVVAAEMNVNVQIVADGQPVFSGFLSPGERKVWTAAKSISLKADNAGGLRIELNGEPLGRLGQVGQRFEHEWRVPNS